LSIANYCVLIESLEGLSPHAFIQYASLWRSVIIPFLSVYCQHLFYTLDAEPLPIKIHKRFF